MANEQEGSAKASKHWVGSVAAIVVLVLFLLPIGYLIHTNEQLAAKNQEFSLCILLLPLAIVVSVVGGCTFMFYAVGERVAGELAKELKIKVDDIPIPNALADTAVVTRTKELNREIERAANYHLTVVQKLMAYHYFALLGGLISGALSAVFGFSIPVSGWKEAGNCMQAGFLTSAGLLTLFVATTKTFRYSDNISKNGDLFQGYAVLLGKLRTGLMVPVKGKNTLDESEIIGLVREVENDLAKLRSIGLAFDSINTSALSITMPGKHQ